MFMASREVYDLRHFGLRDFVGVDAANTDAAAMHVEHDACRLFAALAKKTLEHMNNELHRRVVVIEKKHLVHRGLLRLWLALDDDAGLQIVAADFVVVAHLRANCSPRQNQPRSTALMIWDRQSTRKDPSDRIAQCRGKGTFWCLSAAAATRQNSFGRPPRPSWRTCSRKRVPVWSSWRPIGPSRSPTGTNRGGLTGRPVLSR